MASPEPKAFVGVSFEDALTTVRGGPPSSAFYALPSPYELNLIYSRGFQGVRPETVTPEQKKLIGEARAATPKLYDIFPWAKGLGKGRLSVPYTMCMKLIEGWGGLFPQVQGDCTVHDTEHAAEIDYCADCLWGETAFKGPIAFENIYRSRGYDGDGWSCEAPAYYIGPQGKGGMLYRKVYEGPNGEKVDLTKYNSAWQSKGRAGVPSWIEEESRKNKAKWIPPIENMDEYRDAIALGFGVSFCSGQGYEDETDEFGVASPRGSWSHAMCHPGCDDRPWAHTKYGGMLGMIQNSWGKWNEINGQPEGAPPLSPGSFWTKASGIARLIDGDQFAICSVWGWDRTNWEAFSVIELQDHMRNSTTQDYYKVRSEQIAEFTKKVVDERMFLAM
jgi:hypothetical protein